ncbi:type I restriction endonuclease subunit R [Desulforamulus aeronauticus]|uniref:Type I restriction enzyme endonuclease subunit n=1 Tax=Desulforamulus aeronauticus DSM 10349 TaxID=1121421 RepID=A0A1M6RAI5_9FIRM|nr:type I restriction endonuclease subunit R [Desulforamulus aeronauticus]SHK29462.1 type I restriction enzyme, R subunit [Desulforamulus aeronauticus DSM 10349]
MNSYTEDHLVEQPAMELLQSIGWETKNCYDEDFGKEGTLGRETTSEVVLTRYLRDAIKHLNPHINLDAVDIAVNEITRDRSSLSPLKANQEIYQLLKDGVPVTYRDEYDEQVDGRVYIVDWKNPENNHYLMVNQFWASGPIYKRRADIVGFVNGIPFVFMELKANHRNIADAYNANLRDYKDTIPQIFWYNALIILSNGSHSKVGSITSTLDFFNEWKRVDSEEEEIKVSLEAMLRGVCDHGKLLDIVENFVLYKDDVAKIVPKNHQYLGVNNAIEAVHDIKNRDGKLGVFWHAQGSGKSFSMVFFTQKILRKIPGNWTFVVVTDRNDLDDQIYKTFSSVGAINEDCQADSCEGLRQMLKEDHKMVFTLIQKFQWEGVAKPVTLRDDVIVITDEAHRSQYDTLAQNMRRALPNASFIGFTGTPLMQGDAVTRDVFGNYVSVYDFSAAIEDGATVPLYYENRIPELQLINEDLNDDLNHVIEDAMLDDDQEARMEREFLREYHLITREERLDKIAEDIVSHYMNRGYMGKALVVSIDKMTAVKMYFKVKNEWAKYLAKLKSELATASDNEAKALEIRISYMEETDMAVVISSSQNEVDDFRKKDIDILPIRKRIQKETLDEHFKDAEHPMRIVFVCAMWITGFDVQSLSTVYLDKPMRNHTLMQTIARANRIFEGKTNGLIVDYVGVFRNLQKALSIYAKPGTGGIDVPVKNKEQLVNDMIETISQVKGFCLENNIDLNRTIAETRGFEKIALMDDMVDALVASDDTKKKFMQYASLAWRIFKAILPDAKANQFEAVCQLLRSLSEKIRSLTAPPNIDHVMADIEQVLDLSIDAEGYIIAEDAENTIDLSGLDFEKMRQGFAKKHKNTEMQKLKTKIEQVLFNMVAQNRTRADYLERFEKMIEEYNSGSKNVDIIYKNLVDLAETLNDEQKRHIQENLSEEQLALFDILTKPEFDLTEKEKQQVKVAARQLLETLKTEKLVLDWRKKQQARAEVLYTIEKVLDDDLPRSFSTELYRKKCELVYQHIYDNYYGDGRSIYDIAS